MEKKEAEHLALLRSRQEIDMLKLVESVRDEQVKEAQANIESLEKTRSNAVDRFVFLQRQLGTNKLALDSNGAPIVAQSLMLQVQDTGMPDDFRSLSLIQPEINQVWRMQEGHIFSTLAGGFKTGGAATATIAAGFGPTDKLTGAWKAFVAIGKGLDATGDLFGILATNANAWEKRAGLIASWQRRRDEWVQQSRMTAEEIRQIDKQITALEIRVALKRLKM